MALQDAEDQVPEQQIGAHKEFEHSIMLETEDDADEFFVIAKDRLLHVNDWKSLCGTPSATFQLTDAAGHELHHAARKGDYIKITIPGPPASSVGSGYDWVQVENIVYDDYPDENRELLTMTVRPAANPENAKETTAHFFTEAATSSFVVERLHSRVTVYYYGRNEVNNTETDRLGDAVRNFVVGTGAKLFSSQTQWEELLKGLLRDE